MSDLHWGKKTATFGPDVLKDRLSRLGGKLMQERAKRNVNFDELRVFMLGDMNDGSDIYPGQPHAQAETNVEQQAWELSDFLAEWLREQLQVWRKITVDAVPGNHGRAGKFAHEAANWDVVAYRYLKSKVEKDGINVCFNTVGDLFIRKVQIRGHNYLLYHGHDIKSFGNIPWYGMLLRLSRWSTTNLAPFDVACMGHFHCSGHWQINKLQMLTTGAAVSDDDWALRFLGWESSPRWWLLGVSDAEPIAWQTSISLEK